MEPAARGRDNSDCARAQLLVKLKLEVAEMYEEQLKLVHQMRHAEAAALAPRTPTASMQVARPGELIKAKTRRVW